jgi:hypothetical protein
MPYENSSRRQRQADPVIVLAVLGILAVIGVVAALAKTIADALGADFWVVLNAMGRMAVGIAVFGGLVIGAFYLGLLHRLGWAIGLLFSTIASVIWWCFGTVLDSMAVGGIDPASANAFHFGDPPWWDTGWLQWGGSAVLLVFVVVCAVCALDDR